MTTLPRYYKSMDGVVAKDGSWIRVADLQDYILARQELFKTMTPEDMGAHYVLEGRVSELGLLAKAIGE